MTRFNYDEGTEIQMESYASIMARNSLIDGKARPMRTQSAYQSMYRAAQLKLRLEMMFPPLPAPTPTLRDSVSVLALMRKG